MLTSTGRRSGAASLVALSAILALSSIGATSSKEARDGWTIDQTETYEVGPLTGGQSLNRTDLRWGVWGTDLGSMFEHRGRIYQLFGDTFDTDQTDWRSNVMAWSSDSDPTNGLRFDGMITDRPGHAKELIHNDEVPGDEITVIPTYGASVNNRMFLHYMAVNFWGPPGEWTLSRSGLAYSDDDGQTWTVSDVHWPGDSNFGQVAMVEVGRYIYLMGIPGGRFGHAELARVKRANVLDMDAYRYWNGNTWGSDPDAAATVVPAPVAELSIRWNSHYGKWIMMTKHQQRNDSGFAIVVRIADCLAGPWSEEEWVFTNQDVHRPYGPYMPPRWNDGADIYFAVSKFFPIYNVFWWHTALEGVERGNKPAMCISG